MHDPRDVQSCISKSNSIKALDLLARVIDSLPDLLFVLDSNLQVVLSNWGKQTGSLGQDLKGKPCYQFFMQRQTPCEPCHAMEVFKTGQPQELEHENPVDGQIRNIQVLPVFDENGKVVLVVEHLRNITQQKKNEAVLARLSVINAGLAELGKEMLRLASRVEVSQVMLDKARELTESPCGFVDYWDVKTGQLKLAAFFSEYPSGNQAKQDLDSALHKAVIERFHSHRESLLINDPSHGNQWPKGRREPLQFERILSVPALLGSKLMGQVTLCNAPRSYTRQDLSVVESMASLYAFAMQHLNDTQALMDYQQRLRTLAAQLSAAEDRERRLIAADLHDSVGQYLSMANQRLKMLRMDQPPPPHTLDQIIMLVDKAILETRSLTAQLSPPVLYLIGLEAALEWLTDISQERFGLKIEVMDDGSYKPLDHEARDFLFRAVLELVNNVAKHADTNLAVIVLEKEDDYLKLSVADHGKGFDYCNADPFDSEGFGLFSIRERIFALGGRIVISSEPDNGTTVTLLWPLKHYVPPKRI